MNYPIAMPSQPHHAVQTIRERAGAVLSPASKPATGGFWRRWFDEPNERHFVDEVRAFVAALDCLLDVPPTMISAGELAEVGTLVDKVARRVEAAIAEPGDAAAEAAASLTPAIYVIRARYEELYKRGAARRD